MKDSSSKPQACPTNCKTCDSDVAKCGTCFTGFKTNTTSSLCDALTKTDAECKTTVAFKTIVSAGLVALVAFFKF